jgi:NADH:ubiquinone oxidoreductase subunit 6 (subunit J)
LPRSVEVGTTQFLAFEVFSEWELALLLTGMILVVALQAGVFLAREEPE